MGVRLSWTLHSFIPAFIIHSFNRAAEKVPALQGTHVLQPEDGHETGSHIKWLQLGKGIEGWGKGKEQEIGGSLPCAVVTQRTGRSILPDQQGVAPQLFNSGDRYEFSNSPPLVTSGGSR